MIFCGYVYIGTITAGFISYQTNIVFVPGLKYKCPLCSFEANKPIELVRHAETEHKLPLYKGKTKSAFDEG